MKPRDPGGGACREARPAFVWVGVGGALRGLCPSAGVRCVDTVCEFFEQTDPLAVFMGEGQGIDALNLFLQSSYFAPEAFVVDVGVLIIVFIFVFISV